MNTDLKTWRTFRSGEWFRQVRGPYVMDVSQEGRWETTRGIFIVGQGRCTTPQEAAEHAVKAVRQDQREGK